MDFTGERFIPEIRGTVELEHLNRYYFVVNQVDLKNKIVLDIASGEGYGSEILSRNAKQVIGVDISYETVEHSCVKYKKDNLKFVQGDATKIPLEDNTVDVVVSFETIEHHDKHIEMLNEIKRVLNPNGILVISSPDKQFFLSKEKNKYHVKELYYNEFKQLISFYFSKTFFFSQRTFGGSIIALDENYNHYSKPLIVERSGESHPLIPIYNIALATNSSKFELSEELIFYTESDLAITQQDVENAIYDTIINLHNTKAYRLGKFILKPFSFFRTKILRK